MDLNRLEPEHSSLHTLRHELTSATSALDAAFSSDDQEREDRVREAREALEAFKLLERTQAQFTVPRKVRQRIEWAISELDGGKLELADSDIRWAGGLFEKAVVEYYKRKYGSRAS
jgi:hypothetical protein